MSPMSASGIALARNVQVRQMVALMTASARNGKAKGANALKCRVEPGASAMNRADPQDELDPCPDIEPDRRVEPERIERRAEERARHGEKFDDGQVSGLPIST